MDVLSVSFDGVTDKNLFLYCDNNPISRKDFNGGCWVTIASMAVGGVVGMAISTVSSIATQQAFTGTVNWKSVGVAAATGLVSGVVSASPLGPVAQQVFGGLINGASYVADCYVNDKAVKSDELALSVGMGVLSGKIGGPGANHKNVLTNAANSTKQTIAREMRRANQKYAQKAIASSLAYRNNIILSTLCDSSFKYAVGTVSSNFTTGIYSEWNLFPNAPSWKFWS